ncbi:MAG: PilT/PilU family type 4a pilus ATPase [Nitrospirae bacterium]|nr:PilT/PilU family type 4a pilus ATPase [Nitrospirota bacterium]MCL5238106.1 PilT/PilU family type 4a pilus ATPase [Nitrospirota bacterium]
MATLFELLKLMIERSASDLHITTGSPPKLRIVDKLATLEDCPALTPEDTKSFCYSIMTELQKQKFEENNELDLSFGVKGLSRFRANIFMQRGAVAGAFRAIPFDIQSLSGLGLPDTVEEFVRKPHGLILVTGPTGSGKSTTLASMIDRINSEREAHIVTIEDPIEFLHSHKKCIVNQREVNSDTSSFRCALSSILRQDPDIVFIGEMHDIETIEAAITIAETGHLTLATLHTCSAIQTINRIIDVFPPHQQEQIRVQLSLVLEGVISQRLLTTQDGNGRTLAFEILVPTPAIRSLIRENKLQQIYSVMLAGQGRSGMKTMNQSLYELYAKGLISSDDSISYSSIPEEMVQILSKGSLQDSRTKNGGK